MNSSIVYYNENAGDADATVPLSVCLVSGRGGVQGAEICWPYILAGPPPPATAA